MNKVIIFDLFGVLFTKGLASSIERLKAVFMKPVEKIASSYQQYEEMFDQGLIDGNEFWARINRDLDTKVPAKLLTDLVINSYLINDNLLRLIKYLPKDYKVVIYSNFRREWYDILNKRHRFEQHFDKVFISSDTEVLKPDPKSWDIVYRYGGLNKGDYVLIDDNIDNVKSFKEWGGNGLLFENIYTIERSLRAVLDYRYPEYNDYYSGVILQAKNGAYILQRRDDIPGIQNPGMLSFFGGRRFRNETAIDCAKRELLEETGLEISGDRFNHIGTYSAPEEYGGWTLCDYYLVDDIEFSDVKFYEGQAEIWSLSDAIKQQDLTSLPHFILEKTHSNQK